MKLRRDGLQVQFDWPACTADPEHVGNRREYKERQMAAYTELQGTEFAAELDGYGAVKHQSLRWTPVTSMKSPASAARPSTLALKDSTEEAGAVHHSQLMHSQHAFNWLRTV